MSLLVPGDTEIEEELTPSELKKNVAHAINLCSKELAEQLQKRKLSAMEA